MRRRQWLAASTGVVLLLCASVWVAQAIRLRPPPLRAASSTFLVEPYLQLGRRGDPQAPELVWASTKSGARWSVAVKPAKGSSWSKVLDVKQTSGHIEGLPPFTLCEAQLSKLPPGQTVAYRVELNSKPVFNSTIRASKTAADTVRAIVVGDVGSGSLAQHQLAGRMYALNPDMVVIPGDIVYRFGRSSEYLDHFFPVYNAPGAGADGAPLMRKTLFVAAPGNHDTAIGGGEDSRHLDVFPDGLGYFVWWRQALNGPDLLKLGKGMAVPQGSDMAVAAFKDYGGDEWPREQNFSFDIGSAHFTVLDANHYVDWQDPALRQWLQNDLSATKQPWKFVVFHQSPFNSDRAHFNEQHMRVLSDVFQNNGVNVVFTGHMHSYQRSYPLKFHAIAQPDGKLVAANDNVNGAFDIDKKFDGVKDKYPDGVIYIISGGGGAHLSGNAVSHHPEAWQPYTCKFLSDYSVCCCDIGKDELRIRQVGVDGKTLDEIAIAKQPDGQTRSKE